MKKRLLIFFSILVLSLPIAIKNVKAQTTQEQLDMINEVCQLLISTGLDSNECKAFLQEYNCEDKNCYKFKLCDTPYGKSLLWCGDKDAYIHRICNEAKRSVFDVTKESMCLMQLEEIDDCETYECYYSKACEIDGVKEYLNDCNITKRKEYAKNLCAELKKVHDKASDAAIAAGRDPQTASKQRAAADANCVSMLEESAGCKDEKCFRRVICEEVTPFADYIDFCAEFKDKQSDEDKKYEEKYNVANCYGFGDTVYYVTMAIKIIQIAAPILLILWASIDLVKSITSNDEKQIVAKRKPIIQRLIAAALVFLVPAIVTGIINAVSVNGDENSWRTCWDNNHFRFKSSREEEEEREKQKLIEENLNEICTGKNSPCHTTTYFNGCSSECIESYDNRCLSAEKKDIKDCITAYGKDFVNDYNSRTSTSSEHK